MHPLIQSCPDAVAFSYRSIDRLGIPADQATTSRISYELRKLRGKGLVRKLKGRNRYALTDAGYRVGMFLTRLHRCCLEPVLDGLLSTDRDDSEFSAHPLDRAIGKINVQFDQLTQLCGLREAG